MTIAFDVTPYYDDFETTGGAKDNNYMRILFRPGKAVQARELTQLQSILQNQIKSFGNHIFQDGSPVFGGHISIDTSTIAIQLQPQYANVDIDLTNFLVNGNSTLIVNATGNTLVKAIVVGIDDSLTNPTLVLKYLTGTRFNDGDVIQVATGVQTQAQLSTANSSSVASVASINEGIFYSGGFFVKVSPQTIILDDSSAVTSSNTYGGPTYRIGLQISEAIVDEISDTNLLDPAQGSFNYQAPGATRYQYNLSLAKRTLSSIDDSAFYELLRVENGLITKQIDYPIYADLDKTLARRTFDQAGDFTVHPFSISTTDYVANSAQFQLVVAPGKAYVKGFEFETIGTTRINVDRARSTNTITDFGMSLEFGNILTVANVYGGNVSGTFDISNYQAIDLHVVPSGNINTSNASVYNSTKIGSARVRDMEYLGLGAYYSYVTEINLTPNTFVAVTGNNNSVQLPLNYTAYANAYANVSITVNTGSIVDSRTIITATGNTLILDRPLSVNANNTSNCSLNFAIKDLEGLVVAPDAVWYGNNVFYNQASGNAYYACMDISYSGKDVSGNTILSDTQFNKLIFPLPQNWVAQNTITNATFYARKNLWSQSFTSGNLSVTSGSGLGTGETLPYGYTSQYIPDNAANTNVMVIVRDKQTSNLSNGQILAFNRGSVSGGNGIYQTDGTHMTIVASTVGNFIGDVLLTVQVTNATSAAVARRTKTAVGNSSNTLLLSTDRYTNGTQVIGSAPASTVYIDSANGYVWFTSNTAMAMTPGAVQNLYVPDVFNVVKIYDSGNTAYAPNSANALLDITANYYINSGQRDNYYDHASLILRPGVSPPTGQTVAMLQFYTHDSVTGFFDADSYSAAAYAGGLIPYYNSPKMGSFALRDSIDFRPTRTIGSSANVNNFNLTGLKIPQPDHSMTMTFQFYLPRIDKLLLGKDKSFRMKTGAPAQYPVQPADSDDSMTMYIITLPAYTANVKEIQIQYVENRRYTMRDIGALDKRIQQLEYYSSLSQLENQAANEKILYNDNVTAKDQYGIITDDFGAFSVSDNKNLDLRCFLEQGALSAYKAQDTFDLNYSTSSGGTYTEHSKVFALSHTEVPAIIQNTATTFISVQPFLFAQFKGHAVLTPQTDHTFSANLDPMVITPPDKPKESPPTPPPPAAPTIPNPPPAPPQQIVVTTINYFIPNPWWWLYGYWWGGIYNYNRIPLTVAGYGLVHPLYNWYGVPVATQTVVSQTISAPNLGSTVQLASGTKGVATAAPVTAATAKIGGAGIGRVGGKLA